MDKYEMVLSSYDKILKNINNLKTKPSVELVAISKYHSADKIRALYQHGHRVFGENYLVELIEKRKELSDLTDITWYFTGHIQSNKIKAIVNHSSAILSLSSLKHADKIQRELDLNNKKEFPVFISINLANEESKSGIAYADLEDFKNHIEANCPNIKLMGLMAIPPKDCDDRITIYEELRNKCDKIGAHKLSLGMSGDLNDALKSGSDQVRIGTAIFGERNYDKK